MDCIQSIGYIPGSDSSIPLPMLESKLFPNPLPKLPKLSISKLPPKDEVMVEVEVVVSSKNSSSSTISSSKDPPPVSFLVDVTFRSRIIESRD